MASYTAYDGKITDVSLSRLTFSCGGKTLCTPFDPPMTSYREARDRVVEMDKECVSALGRSDITVKEFLLPYGWHTAEFILVSAVFIGFSMRSNFAPGSILSHYLPLRLLYFCWKIQPSLLTFMLIVHGWETINFASSRLRKHNVKIRSRIYWLWIGTTFIEGISSFKRSVYLTCSNLALGTNKE